MMPGPSIWLDGAIVPPLSPASSLQAASARRPNGSVSSQLRAMAQAPGRSPAIIMALTTVVALVGSR